MQYITPNLPNAGRLVESLRHLGYGNYEALADIVDNSIDADAKTIAIKVHSKQGQIQITIADRGRGMSRSVLDEAMRLGSLTERNQRSDLGKFGMGLVTASLSLARKCHVLTRSDEGSYSSAWDVDEIVLQNSFVKHLDSATSEEEALLTAEIGPGTGTLVILTKCDNLSNRTTTSFASNLKNHLGRVHRYFINAGSNIFVNDDPAPAIDPLQLSDAGTESVMDDLISVHFGLDSERAENIRVRIVLLPETPATELDVNRSMKSQGFYVMRNQREIMAATALNFFTKHNDFNRMRGELFLPGSMDSVVGIEFTKRQVEFDQNIQDQLNAQLVPVCRTIKRREATKKRVQTSDAQQRVHAQSVKVITEKNKLLLKPKAVIEKRLPSKDPKTREMASGEQKRERKELNRTQSVESELNCVIREERLGPNGQIYECDMEGRKLVIRYNIEHPFYQRFVGDKIDESRSVTASDFLIFSMASAELREIDEGRSDSINNFKAVLSANLRTLLN